MKPFSRNFSLKTLDGLLVCLIWTKLCVSTCLMTFLFWSSKSLSWIHATSWTHAAVATNPHPLYIYLVQYQFHKSSRYNDISHVQRTHVNKFGISKTLWKFESSKDAKIWSVFCDINRHISPANVCAAKLFMNTLGKDKRKG